MAARKTSSKKLESTNLFHLLRDINTPMKDDAGMMGAMDQNRVGAVSQAEGHAGEITLLPLTYTWFL